MVMPKVPCGKAVQALSAVNTIAWRCWATTRQARSPKDSPKWRVPLRSHAAWLVCHFNQKPAKTKGSICNKKPLQHKANWGFKINEVLQIL